MDENFPCTGYVTFKFIQFFETSWGFFSITNWRYMNENSNQQWTNLKIMIFWLLIFRCFILLRISFQFSFELFLPSLYFCYLWIVALCGCMYSASRLIRKWMKIFKTEEKSRKRANGIIPRAFPIVLLRNCSWSSNEQATLKGVSDLYNST